jgi:vacuolar-type H+-ATPase subunit H
LNEKRIQQVLDIEKQAQAIYEAAVEEARAIPVQAEQEAQVILDKARADAEKEASQMIDQAQSDVESKRILAEMEEKVRRSEVIARSNYKRAVADVLYRVVGKE